MPALATSPASGHGINRGLRQSDDRRGKQGSANHATCENAHEGGRRRHRVPIAINDVVEEAIALIGRDIERQRGAR
jgi:hypothetical protein